ncbi:MAG: sortase B protein-sorting domain-containing protein [Gemmataceae bacterium]|nr:sortase B protein-sorting domain-containing protein [Gemmataceae bacterium]
MSPVLKRIAANGLGAAAVLGLLGLGFGELAALSLAAQTPDRVIPVEAVAEPEPNPVGDALRYRVPAMMALYGFLLVAAGELVLARRRKPAPPPAETKPDPAELLLEQLLREAEAKSRAAGENSSIPGERGV